MARRGSVVSLMGFDPVLTAFVACVAGCFDSLPGAVLGGFLLGFLEVAVLALLPQSYGGLTQAAVFFGIPKVFTLPHITVLVILAILAARIFRESLIGVQLRASADDEVGARAMGVNVYRTRLIAWVLSALFIAVAGIAYAFFLGSISARPFYFHYVFLTVSMLILGGLRRVSGAVIGTLMISLGLELVRWLETGPQIVGVKLPQMLDLSGLLLGVVIVAVMAFRPSGLLGNREIEDVFIRTRNKGN